MSQRVAIPVVGGLRGRLLAAFLVLGLGPTAIGAFIVEARQADIAQREAIAHLEGMADAQTARVETLLNRDLELVDLIARNTGLIAQVSAIEPGQPQVLTVLANLVGSTNSVRTAVIVNEDGCVIGSASPSELGDFRLDLLRTEPGADPVIGRAYAAADDETVLVLHATLFDGSRNIGTLGIEISLDELDALVTDYSGLGETGETSVARITQQGSVEFLAPLRFGDTNFLEASVPTSSTEAPIIMALHGDDGVHLDSKDYRGAAVFAATRSIPTQDWAVVVKMDRAEALASVGDFRRQMRWVALATAALMVGLALWASRSMVRPLARLTQSAGSISRGDLVHRAELEGPTELRQLAAAFNRMTDQLIERIATEGERTRALSEINQRLSASERHLEHQATHDSLTGLANRAMLADAIDRASARARRHGGHVAVLFCDLDRFKVINDSMGHAVGDRLLRRVAAAIRASVRSSDLVCRFGGDEFVILLDDVTDEDAPELTASTLLSTLSDSFEIGGVETFITVSIGIAVSDGSLDRDALLANADVAMYRAKELGRGRFVRYRSSMREQARERHQLGVALHRALERHELHVAYQPIVDLGSNMTIGVEALLRWTTADGTIVAPSTFVPLAEEIGAIDSIGAWVLRRACADVARWNSEHAQSLRVAINVSPRQLADPEFVSLVQATLSEYEMSPQQLTLEVTEGVVAETASRALTTVDELGAIGVALTIDDFGTGDSSLTYLSQLPVKCLKVDRAFVAGLGPGRSSDKIVTSIVSLAVGLGLDVIAAGVEHPVQIERLERLGCRILQGNHFAAPGPLNANLFAYERRLGVV